MARQRQLEGSALAEAGGEMHFSDEELDESGNPIGEESEEEEESELDDGDPDADGEAEDRGDEHSALDDEEGDADIDALEAVAATGRRTVPIDRLNQVLADNDRLRGIIEQAAVGGQQRQAAAAPAAAAEPVFDLKGKLKERAEAILEGDTDKIVALDEEIENYRNTTVRQQGEQAGRVAASQAYQADRMQEIVNTAFQRYPFLNDGSADFNKEALDDVLMYKNRYIAEGESASSALKRAVNRVCPFYAEELDGDDGKRTNPARRRAAAAEAEERDPNARDPKKIQRNARAGNRVPPNLGRNGTGNGVARREMTERSAKEIPASEMRQMSEEEKKRLRGDYV